MSKLNQIFFRGLVTLLPIAVTIYVLYSAIVILDNFLGALLREVLPTYIPGLGLMAIIGLIFLFGLLLNNMVMERILSFLEKKLLDVPFIRAIYSPLKDLMNLFSKNNERKLQTVVMVKMGNTNNLAMGLVTREKFDELKAPHLTEDKVAVFFPFSYGMGGYTFLVPRADIQQINIPIEKAMSLAITGWVRKEDNGQEDTQNNFGKSP